MISEINVGDTLYRWTMDGVEKHVIIQISGPFICGPYDYMECVTDKGVTKLENINSGCVVDKDFKCFTYYDTHKRGYFTTIQAAINDRIKYINEWLKKLSITTKLYEDELKGEVLNN